MKSLWIDLHAVGSARRLLVKSAETAMRVNPVNAPIFGPVAEMAADLILDPMRIAVLTSKYWGPDATTVDCQFHGEHTVRPVGPDRQPHGSETLPRTSSIGLKRPPAHSAGRNGRYGRDLGGGCHAVLSEG
jgi:hypothetical protein